MCTALAPRRSPLTRKTAATVHNRLWPTARSLPATGRNREVSLRPAPLRLLSARDTTSPRGVPRSLLLVRGGVALPRLVPRRPCRSTLPRVPLFLFCPIVCPILRFVCVDPQCPAVGLAHAELFGTLPYPRRAGQLRDPDLEPLPFVRDPTELHAEFGGPGIEPRGDRVQIDAPQHQEHGHHDEHGEPATPPGGLAPQRAVRRHARDRPRGLCGERGPLPALRGGHQPTSLGGSAVLVAVRSRAEALRGFSPTSRSEGLDTAPRRNTGRAPQTHTGNSGGQTQRPSLVEMKRLTKRSSPEWNVTTASLPPATRSRSVASRALCRPPSSSLTATRTAWKTRLAGLPPLSFQPTAARTASYSSVVTASGFLLTTSRTTLRASPRGTSPYSERTRANSDGSTVFRYSAAEGPEPGSIRMSRGPSWT